MLSEDSLQTKDNKMEIIFVVGDKQEGIYTSRLMQAACIRLASRMNVELKLLYSKRKSQNKRAETQ